MKRSGRGVFFKIINKIKRPNSVVCFGNWRTKHMKIKKQRS